jgi:hypothetical protein
VKYVTSALKEAEAEYKNLIKAETMYTSPFQEIAEEHASKPTVEGDPYMIYQPNSAVASIATYM